MDVSKNEIILTKPYTTHKPVFNCSDGFEKLALALMAQHGLSFPQSASEGRSFYNNMLLLINNI